MNSPKRKPHTNISDLAAHCPSLEYLADLAERNELRTPVYHRFEIPEEHPSTTVNSTDLPTNDSSAHLSPVAPTFSSGESFQIDELVLASPERHGADQRHESSHIPFFRPSASTIPHRLPETTNDSVKSRFREPEAISSPSRIKKRDLTESDELLSLQQKQAENLRVFAYSETARELIIAGLYSIYKGFQKVLHGFGFGRHVESCMSIRQFLWFKLNSIVLEDFLSDRADDDKCFRIERCEILHNRFGEPPIAWDAFQKILFLSSQGAILAERHGVITEDEHLLIMHKLIRIPQYIREHFISTEAVTIASACCMALRIFLNRYRRDVSAENCYLRPNYQPGDRLDRAGEFDMARLQPSPESPRSSSSQSTLTSIPPVNSKEVVIFQHGLLESSLNWILTVTPRSKIDFRIAQNPITFLVAVMKVYLKIVLQEIQSAGVILLRLIRGQELICSSSEKPAEIDSRLRNSLPLRLFTEGAVSARTGARIDFDVWLSNSRGNAFTTTVSRHTSRLAQRWREGGKLGSSLPSCLPMGYGETVFDEIGWCQYIANQDWTHQDMALFDVEAIYAKIASFYQRNQKVVEDFSSQTARLTSGSGVYAEGPTNSSAEQLSPLPSLNSSGTESSSSESMEVLSVAGNRPLRPILIGFSQGAAMILLNFAYRQVLNCCGTEALRHSSSTLR